MCKYRILQFGCPCYDRSHAQPTVEIWLSRCDSPHNVPSISGWPPICLQRRFCFPAQKIAYHQCVVCSMQKNARLIRRDYITQIRKCLDRLDHHVGGNPWVDMFRPYASAWANFVFHNSPSVLGVDMEAIRGGDILGVTGLELLEPEGDNSPEDRAGGDASVPESDLEDDLDEWDTEDDEALDDDDV